jgi:hypothetical protein
MKPFKLSPGMTLYSVKLMAITYNCNFKPVQIPNPNSCLERFFKTITIRSQ